MPSLRNETSDVQVNTTVGDNYNNPQVAALEDGGWIVTWSPQPPTAPGVPPIDNRAVYYQRFDADGQFVGDETQVNPPSLTYSFNGTVTGLQSGGWIIAWNELNGFGGQLDSFSQRYDADDTPVGEALLVNTHLPGNQNSPHVEELANGDTVFSWSSEGQDQSSYGAFQTLLKLNFERKTIAGKDIAEVLDGGGGDDDIMGLAGDDTISAGASNDTVDGGDGHDSINGDDDDDEISGGLGNDFLAGDGGHDTISGGEGYDTIRGFTGHDYIDGGDQKDIILGDNGDDTLFGGHGNDAIRGGNGHDSIEGGIGNDRLFGGNSGDDTIFGGEGRDPIRAGNHHDLLDGGAGNDTMIGGAGFDTLIGGAGDDVMVGSFNADRFVFADFHGNDTITDFDAKNNAEKINSFDEVFGVGGATGAASQVGLNVVIVTGADSSVVLENVLLSDLDAVDFIF